MLQFILFYFSFCWGFCCCCILDHRISYNVLHSSSFYDECHSFHCVHRNTFIIIIITSWSKCNLILLFSCRSFHSIGVPGMEHCMADVYLLIAGLWNSRFCSSCPCRFEGVILFRALDEISWWMMQWLVESISFIYLKLYTYFIFPYHST